LTQKRIADKKTLAELKDKLKVNVDTMLESENNRVKERAESE